MQECNPWQQSATPPALTVSMIAYDNEQTALSRKHCGLFPFLDNECYRFKKAPDSVFPSRRLELLNPNILPGLPRCFNCCCRTNDVPNVKHTLSLYFTTVWENVPHCYKPMINIKSFQFASCHPNRCEPSKITQLRSGRSNPTAAAETDASEPDADRDS